MLGSRFIASAYSGWMYPAAASAASGATLDEDHEIALRLASFGQSITLSVVDIGYSNPSTLVFHGYVGDQPATLIQHMSQLNFLLLAVKKADPEKPPRRIGFESPIED